MILYGIDNIRDLFGHKVWLCDGYELGKHIDDHVINFFYFLLFASLQVDLSLIKSNPICRIGIQ